ncbi:MAG: hypothetical protein L3J41_00625 [Melioribacteraceae bacterium]|nr:hypothetical protein [Melioribacteraceae bacterium]
MKTHNIKLYFLLLFLFSATLPSTLFSQRFEVTPYYGFMFAGKINFVDGEMNVKDNWNYGIIFNFELDRRHGLNLELFYDRLDTRATYKKYGGFQDEKDLFDMFIEYYQLGALYNHTLSKKASAFGVFTGGVVRFSPISTKYGDDYRFAVTMGGGIKYFFTKNIGLRLHGRIKLPIYFSGGGMYLGSGGSGFYLGAGTALLQMDINAGLTFRLGD